MATIGQACRWQWAAVAILVGLSACSLVSEDGETRTRSANKIAASTTTVNSTRTHGSGNLTKTAIAPAPTPAEASRFLAQATFGPTEVEINDLTISGYDAWLNTQFGETRASHLDFVLALEAQGLNLDNSANVYAIESFWDQAITGKDQLRQRVAWALSQILVVGGQDNVRNAAYYDLLEEHAFGNYRELLEAVTLSPPMGQWLSHIANQKEDLVTGRLPDENYAREVMQLFTIGLWQLNPDGTRRLDGLHNPIPTYDQDDIRGMAKVLTGWTYAGCDPVHDFSYCFESARKGGYRRYDDVVLPMQAYAAYHSTVAKIIVTKKLLPGGRSASDDLKDAIDTLFSHPNIGPFISCQLIQRLVKSNPSPAYVGRVSAAFANNGSGVRGDMKAVIRAILLDPEARDLTQAQGNSDGKLREPVLRLAQYFRVFTIPPANHRFNFTPVQMDKSFRQRPMSSPSVFNFYRPDYLPPGEMSQNETIGPEFQILDEASLVDSSNFIENWATYAGNKPGGFTYNYAPFQALAGNPAALVDKLDLLLTSDTLSLAARTTIINAVAGVPASDPAKRFRMALMLFESAPDYLVQK